MKNQKHEWVRDVLTLNDKTAAKCSCGKFHYTRHDEMEICTDIPSKEIKEIAIQKPKLFLKFLTK